MLALLEGEVCVETDGLRYVKDGVLDTARHEIHSKPLVGEANTAGLQPHEMLRSTEHV